MFPTTQSICCKAAASSGSRQQHKGPVPPWKALVRCVPEVEALFSSQDSRAPRGIKNKPNALKLEAHPPKFSRQSIFSHCNVFISRVNIDHTMGGFFIYPGIFRRGGSGFSWNVVLDKTQFDPVSDSFRLSTDFKTLAAYLPSHFLVYWNKVLYSKNTMVSLEIASWQRISLIYQRLLMTILLSQNVQGEPTTRLRELILRAQVSCPNRRALDKSGFSFIIPSTLHSTLDVILIIL